MAKRLSRYFGISALQLHKMNVFNAFIGIDNSLFADPNLLKSNKIREFEDARDVLEKYFSNVITLLKASKQKGTLLGGQHEAVLLSQRRTERHWATPAKANLAEESGQLWRAGSAKGLLRSFD